MKQWIFSLLLLLGSTINMYAQNGADSVAYNEKREKRINNYKSFWESLVPAYTKVQYAGSIGFLSFGTGWDYGKHNQWETDVYIGFIPKYSTDKVKFTFTVKQNYIPWDIPVGNKGFAFEPLTCAVSVNTIFGSDFWSKSPNDRYPESYYGFSTKLRFNVGIGERITYNIPVNKRFFTRAITFYYEIGSNDLYLVTALQNRYLKPTDYIKLSFGLKFQFI